MFREATAFRVVLGLSVVSVEVARGQSELYWVELGGIQSDYIMRANLDGLNAQTLTTLFNDVDPSGVVFDSVHDVLYWTDNTGVVRATPDVSSYTTMVPAGNNNRPFGIDLDVAHGYLYWCAVDGIYRASLDGTGVELIIPIPNFFFSAPPTLSIDETGGYLYYTWRHLDSQTNVPRIFIQKAKLDGSQVVTLVDEGDNTYDSYGIAVDRLGRKLYWTRNDQFSLTGSIRRSDLDGSNVTTLYDFGAAEYPASLAVQEQTGALYWYDTLGHRIRRGSVDGAAAEDVVTGTLGLVLGISVRQSGLCTSTTVFADITAPFLQANLADVFAVVECFQGSSRLCRKTG